MVISRPCIHPECPPRDGFIRGQYESVEFIREIPKKPMKLSSSLTDLPKAARSAQGSLEKEALLRKAGTLPPESTAKLPNGDGKSQAAAEDLVREGRQRGKTISFAGSRGASAKGEAMDSPHDQDEDETNPVEWIMITRSDPGGSVPRFMVERGTPGGIVADASKFLDWACKKDHPEDEVEALEEGNTELIKKRTRQELEAYETNGHLAGVDGSSEHVEPPTVAVPRCASLDIASPPQAAPNGGVLSSMVGAAYAGIESYAPQAVIDRMPGHPQDQAVLPSLGDVPEDTARDDNRSGTLSPALSQVSSIGSFASAGDHFEGDDNVSARSISATSQSKSLSSKDTKDMSPHEKELAKLNERKRLLNEKLVKAREKETKDKTELTSKEEERVRKAEEKHAKELQKHEEKYKKEVARLEAKRQKEATKVEDRKKKAEDKDEKARLNREKEETRQELEVMKKERDILREQVGALQRENTSLVVRLGKMEEGKEVLKEVKSELDSNRSRSSSIRRGKEAAEKAKEATVLGGEKPEAVEAMK